MTRLVRVILGLALVGLASMLVGPVLGTVLTPGWVADADGRDWAGMMFFLAIAAAFLLVAVRLVSRRGSTAPGVLRSSDWWGVAALSIVATVCTAIASHWMIALPGIIPIGGATLMARRRAREERAPLVGNGVLPSS